MASPAGRPPSLDEFFQERLLHSAPGSALQSKMPLGRRCRGAGNLWWWTMVGLKMALFMWGKSWKMGEHGDVAVNFGATYSYTLFVGHGSIPITDFLGGWMSGSSTAVPGIHPPPDSTLFYIQDVWKLMFFLHQIWGRLLNRWLIRTD